MTATVLWAAIAITVVATVLMKAAGPLLVGARALPRRVTDVTALAAPALLAGLLVVELGGDGWSADGWPRLAGVAAGGVTYLLRAPMLVAVGVAMLVTALLRLWMS